MKKTIIAGAASAVLAAMPVVGVFAADTTTQTDTLNITLAETCTIAAEGGVTHENGTGTWDVDKLSQTGAVAGQTYTMGSTTFKIVCNSANGWKVTASAGDLTGKTSSEYKISKGSAAAGTSTWKFTPSTEDGSITAGAANASPVASSTVVTGSAGKTFKVTYDVATGADIIPQAYEGTIEYTLSNAAN